MSLLPLLNELMSYRQPNVYDQLAHELQSLRDELLHPAVMSQIRKSGCPWKNLVDPGLSTIRSNKDEFRVNLDVQQFKPEELKVSVADGYLVVEGQHEERSDQHGYISRQFTRRCKIPDDVDEKTIVSNLSSDGVLTLKAPKKSAPGIQGREIPIVHTNQPAVKQGGEAKAEKSEQI